MSLIPEISAGAISPEACTVNVTSSAEDLTTAIAATIEVGLPDGTHASWSASIVAGASSSAVKVRHFYAAGDVDQIGLYVAFARLALAGGGFVRSRPRLFRVRNLFR